MVVSIHANAGGGKGTEVFTYKAKEVTQARAVLNNLVALGFSNRGIKDGSGLAMVKRPKATAMLIEVCFVDTQSDVDLYNSIRVEKIANAIVSGIVGEEVKETEGKAQSLGSDIKEKARDLGDEIKDKFSRKDENK